MGYLCLTRRPHEAIELYVQPGTTAEELFAALRERAIYIRIAEFQGGQVKLGIEAPACIGIVRAELLDG